MWVEGTNYDDVKLSGVGNLGQYPVDGVVSVPIDDDKRYDEPVGLVPMIDVQLGIPLHDQVPPHPFWGWAFHSSCWDLLCQTFTPDLKLLFAALLSVPIQWDGMVNWGHTYGGAAEFQTYGSVLSLASCFSRLSPVTPDFRTDPLHIPGLDEAIGNHANLKHDPSHSRLVIANLSPQQDIFSRLATELLEHIVTLLPTRDARSLRLASPVFATLNLSVRFWASRFRPGNEYEHITEVFHNPPISWKTLYLTLPTLSRDNPNMVNRRRVWKLVQRLQTAISQMANTPCNGSPAEPSVEEDVWQTARREIIDPEARFNCNCRVLRVRTLHISQPLRVQCMSVSLAHTVTGIFVSGLAFVHQDGGHDALGYIHQDQSVPIRFSTPQRIQGWQLALDTSGVRAIAVVAEDGTVSPWAGEPGNFPRWHLAEDEGIFAVRAEFDVGFPI